MNISNFSKGPVGSYAAQALGLTIDGTDPMQKIADNMKKRNKGMQTGTPNITTPFGGAASSLLNANGNQY